MRIEKIHRIGIKINPNFVKYESSSTLYIVPLKELWIFFSILVTIVPLLSTIVDMPSDVPLAIHLLNSRALALTI